MLYKYQWEDHAIGFVEHGRVRVGTLYDFRDKERHRKGIADAVEGRASSTETQRGGQWGYELSDVARRVVDTGPFSYSENCEFVSHLDSPNLLVYCVSRELSRDAAGEYNACVEIHNPVGFWTALRHFLQEELGHGFLISVDDISYRARDINIVEDHELHPAFVKEPFPEFVLQREVRAVWQALEFKPDQPFYDFTFPRLRDFVRLAAIPNQP